MPRSIPTAGAMVIVVEKRCCCDVDDGLWEGEKMMLRGITES